MELAQVLHACAVGRLSVLDTVDLTSLPRLRYCRTPLMTALDKNQHAVIRRLLELGVDVNRRTALTRAPLLTACERNYHVDMIMDLVHCGAVVDSHEDALHLVKTAITCCDSEQVDKILDFVGARLTHQDSGDVLSICVRRGFHQVFRRLILEIGLDFNVRDNDGRTLLHDACEKGSVPIAEALLENGICFDTMSDRGITPLAIAVKQGNVDLVKLLLDFGADLNSVFQPLKVAYDNHNTRMITLLLEYDIVNDLPDLHVACLLGDVSFLSRNLRTETINFKDHNGQTLLHIACRKKHLDIVELLLNSGINADHQDKKKETALHVVARNGDEKSANNLIQSGSNPFLEDLQGVTALDISCSQGRLDMMKLWMSSVHVVGNNDLIKCFENAMRSNYVDIVRHLLRSTVIKTLVVNGAKAQPKNEQQDLDQEPTSNHVPNTDHIPFTDLIRHACEQGHYQIVDLLLEEKLTSLTFVRSLFPQAISQLCWSGRLDVFQWLWRIGVSVNSRMQDNRTALHFSCQYGLPTAVHAMLGTGASVNVQDTTGLTPLHLACSNNHLPICRYLVNNGARVQVCDEDGCYPMHYCAERGGLELVEFLLDSGADPILPNRKGSSPLHHASRTGNVYAVLELLVNGGNPNMKNYMGHGPIFEVLIGLKTMRARTVLRGKETTLSVQFTNNLEVLELLLLLGADPKSKNCDGKTILNFYLDMKLESENAIIDVFDTEVSKFCWDILQDFQFTLPDMVYILSRLPEPKKFNDDFLEELLKSCCGLCTVASPMLMTQVMKSRDPLNLLEMVASCGMIIPFSCMPDEAKFAKFSAPPGLATLARAAIRNRLRRKGRRMSDNIDNLRSVLPTTLRNYLSFS